MVTLGRGPSDREARDRRWVAPPWLCAILGVQVPPPWATARRRIAAELAKLGHDVSKDSVAKYMPRPVGSPGRPPSTTWGTFVRMHLAGTIAIDFLTVPTATFRTLYVFIVLSLERRVLLHVNVTAYPHTAWAAQQMVEALGTRSMLSA
jgi:hypothetical protein